MDAVELNEALYQKTDELDKNYPVLVEVDGIRHEVTELVVSDTIERVVLFVDGE